MPRCKLLLFLLVLLGLGGCLPASPAAFTPASPTLTAPAAVAALPTAEPLPAFAFAVAGDVRLYSGPQMHRPTLFRGAVEGIAAYGDTAFLISPGDMDPLENARWTIDQVLGADYPWIPVMGNHELPGQGEEAAEGANLRWMLAYQPPFAARPGPPECPTTTYSFDYQQAHFVILNEYCGTGGAAATDGDIPDLLYDWLAADLAANAQPLIFVIGHEPAYPQPDEQTGKTRYLGEALDAYPANRDRFWALLAKNGVTAYLCGHTHLFSAVQIEGVWHIEAGHARGEADQIAPSTYLIFEIEGEQVRLLPFRAEPGQPYQALPARSLRLRGIDHSFGQRSTTTFFWVKNSTASMPWPCRSPKNDSFQPEKGKNAIGAATPMLMPMFPASTS